MKDKAPPDLAQVLNAILQAASEIEAFVSELDRASFERDIKTIRSVMFNLVVIGEACHDLEKHYPILVGQHPELPIRASYAMRNRLAHTYLDYSVDIIWGTAKLDIPMLARMIRAVQRELP